jgi:hypothetical protein
MYPAVLYSLHGIYELHKIRQNELKEQKKEKIKTRQNTRYRALQERMCGR